MARLDLFLLGPPRIEREGTLITVDTRKAIALVTYLAVTRQRHSRDALAALLWPEYDQTNARGALRRTLSTLNKALAGNWLEIDRETITMNVRSDLWLDAENFASLLAECRTHGHALSEVCTACVSPLSAAVTLYRDHFLAGFTLRDSPNFDDWQFYQADSLRRDFASALERLAYCYSAMGDFRTAIGYARRWLALDRLHEPAYRLLMQMYMWSGQRSAALHQYRECVQVLEQELGVAPLEATTQLYAAIKENLATPPPPPLNIPTRDNQHRGASINVAQSLADALGTLHTPDIPDLALAHPSQPLLVTPAVPLVGRGKEWSTLLKAYQAGGKTGQVVILEGEAGIGKTRLAEEFLAYTRSRGASHIAARCYEGEAHLAYSPIVTGLRTVIAQQDNTREIAVPWLSEAARLLPELITLHPGLPPAPPLDSPGTQSRFFEGLRQVMLAMCRASGSNPGIIFFDDLHWADSASLELLTYLLRRLHEQPLCLLLTWRSRQAASDSRLHRLLSDAQRAANTTVLSLSRLSQATVSELVQAYQTDAADESAPAQGLIDRLYAETEGLPFFLVEYLTAMATGVLTADNEDWSLPGGVRDLLHSRLVDVGETGWQLLNSAAVIGRSFDFDTLRETSGRSEEEAVLALEELITRGLVEEVRSATGERGLTYDFSHEKLRTLVYEETSLARRRLLHRRVAEALVHSARSPREVGALAGQIANHYRQAGGDQAAAEYFKLAGEHARSLYAHREALAHLRLALALGHPAAAALHESIGDLYMYLGEYTAALKSYETAAALSELAALAGIEHKLGNVYARRGEWELAESHFEAALHTREEIDEPGERARLYADWSLTAHHAAQFGRALELAQQALALAETADDVRALAQVHNILGILASSQGEVELACQHLQQSLALAESLNDGGTRAAALNNLALAYGTNGEIEQALTLAEMALALCIAQGDRHREAALHNNLADLLHAAGRSEAAMAHLKQAVSIYAEIGVEAGTVQPEIWKLAEW